MSNTITIKLSNDQLDTVVSALTAQMREVVAHYNEMGYDLSCLSNSPQWAKADTLRSILEPIADQNPTPEALEHKIQFGYIQHAQ